MAEAVENPFSSALALGILKLIQKRDLQLLELRAAYQQHKITEEQLRAAMEESEARITDDVFSACQKTMANLEVTVNSVLKIQAQLQEVRDLEAQRIVPPKMPKETPS
jgi:hypothetical protein